MKNLHFLRLAAAVLAVVMTADCTKSLPHSDLSVPREEATLHEMTFTASFGEGKVTRTTVSPENETKVLWSPKDEIKLFCQGNDAKFTATNSTEAAVAEFTGTVTPGGSSAEDGYAYHAVYPYQDKAAFDGRYFRATLDADQKSPEGSFQDDRFITIARSGDTSLAFYNVCSGLRFQVGWSDVSKVTFTATAGEPVAGKVSAAFDETGLPAVNKVSEGKSSITLTPEQGQYFKPGVWYYLVTLPAKLEEGFTISMTGGNTLLYEHTKSVAFNRGKFRSLVLTPENTCYDVVNAWERAFIQQARAVYPGDLDDYRTTIVNQFYRQVGSNEGQYPNPIKLGDAGWVEYAAGEDFSDAVRIEGSTIYNVIPGVKYHYRNDRGEKGTFTAAGPLRTIRIEGVPNIRDLGGWQAGDRRIRYGRIYRGGRLDKIVNQNDILDLGVEVDLDLRGNPPGSQGGSGESYPVKALEYANIQVLMFMAAQNGQNGVTADLYQASIRQVIQWLDQGKRVYFHCHGGADRTGTLAFLIETLLGVSEVDANIDYELTTFGGSLRERTAVNYYQYPFKRLITYLKGQFGGATLQETVTNWATTRHSDAVDPLTLEEIGKLKSLLLE